MRKAISRLYSRRSFLKLSGLGTFALLTGMPGELAQSRSNSPLEAISIGPSVVPIDAKLTIKVGYYFTQVDVWHKDAVIYTTKYEGLIDEYIDAIVYYMKDAHNLLIGDRTAELAVWELGSISAKEVQQTMILRGRCLTCGLPEAREITSIEVRKVLEPLTEALRQRVNLDLLYNGQGFCARELSACGIEFMKDTPKPQVYYEHNRDGQVIAVFKRPPVRRN